MLIAAIDLEAILRALPDLIICMDLSGRILSYKAGNSSSMYLLPDQFLGQQIQTILPPEMGQKFLRALQEALETGEVASVDYQMKGPEGQRWFEARLVSSAGTQVIAILRDVTERIISARQNQRQLKRLSALHSIDAAITSSFDLKVILSVVLRQITGQLGVDAADILLLNQRTRMLEYAAGQGFKRRSFNHTAVMIGQGYRRNRCP